MTTENEKVAGYIIPEVYDRFDQFCQENNLTCSRGLNVVLAEYFGMEETLLIKQTWVGGVTLPKFEELQNKVNEMEKVLSELQSKILNNKVSEGKPKAVGEAAPSVNASQKNKSKSPSSLPSGAEKLNTTELAKRFKVSRGAINKYKKKFRENKISKEEYIEWTKSKDPEGKGWFFDENTNYSV
jgi:hypothetical protein